jgi:hypothetical protein
MSEDYVDVVVSTPFHVKMQGVWKCDRWRTYANQVSTKFVIMDHCSSWILLMEFDWLILQNETVGLPKDWEENSNKVYELCSRKPHYNRVKQASFLPWWFWIWFKGSYVWDFYFHKTLFFFYSRLSQVMRRYELDYRDRTRGGYKIQTSSKNFQLVMEVPILLTFFCLMENKFS